jgi:hypothetical protein
VASSELLGNDNIFVSADLAKRIASVVAIVVVAVVVAAPAD